MVRMPVRGCNAGGADKLFGQRLVHSDGRPEIAGAGIRNSHQVKSRLYAAVFAVQTVQRDKNNIRLAADFENASAEKRRAFELPLLPYLCKVRRLPVENSRLQRRELIKKFLRRREYVVSHIFESVEEIDQNRFMSAASKCRANLCSGQERNLSLRAQSSA